MNLKKKVLLSVLVSNLVIFLPIVVEPTKYYTNLKFWCLYAIYFLLTIPHLYHSEFLSYLQFSKRDADFLLREFFKKIQSVANINCEIFIMTPSINLSPYLGKDKFLKKCLFAEYPLNLEEKLNFEVVRPVKVGVEGFAFNKVNNKIADFEKARNKHSHGWGLQPAELKLLRDFKSGIAVPIKDPQMREKPLGVLVIYSTSELEETPFRETNFQEFLEKINQPMSIIIKGVS